MLELLDFGRWVSHPDGDAWMLDDVGESLKSARDRLFDSIVNIWTAYNDPYDDPIDQHSILLTRIISSLYKFQELISWSLMLPDARTIAEDVELAGANLGPLLERMAAAEARIVVLEGIEPPPMPTLDSLTTEAEERTTEIAETWFKLIEKILDLAG